MPVVMPGTVVPVVSWDGSTTWQTWNLTYTTNTTTTTTNLVWNNWLTGTSTTTGGASYTLVERPGVMLPSNDWAAVQAIQDAARADRARLSVAARAEGNKLLEMILDAAQIVTLKAMRYFDVLGASGQLWRVHRGTSGNVRAIGIDGEEIMAICAHPALWDAERAGHLPTEDVMAAQALHLMHDDSAFLQRANIHRGSSRRLELVPALRAA